MKRIKVVLLTVAILTLPSTVLADNAGSTFQNAGGTLTELKGTTGYDLNVPKSGLSLVSGIQGFDCTSVSTCHGTVNFTTPMTAGFNQSLINNISGGATNLGAGGSFTIHETEGGKALTFVGTFTSATWTFTGDVQTNDYQWSLIGSVNGDLTIGKNGVPMSITGATVQLFTQPIKDTTDPFAKAGGHIGLNGGTTGFPSAVTPESGTLILFGSGLLGIVFVVRRRLAPRV